MNNNYNGQTGLGLDGTVNQPVEGFGLPNEELVQAQPEISVSDQPNPLTGMPTEAELNQYSEQREMSSIVDAPVQYNHEREAAREDKINNLLGSLKTSDERQAYQIEQQALDANKEQLQNEAILRNETAIEADKEKIAMKYVKLPKQFAKVEERQLPPAVVEMIKKLAVVGISIGVGIGAAAAVVDRVVSAPKIVPEQTPSSIELQENIDNAENMDQVIDAINEHKEQQIESGITTHPEKVIEEKHESVENVDMSDSMQNFVDEVNRQKVISIESGVTMHPETVIDNGVGGKSL